MEISVTDVQTISLQNCFNSYTGLYARVVNDCLNPVQYCFSNAGIDIGSSYFPTTLAQDVIDSGLVKSYEFIEQKKPAQGGIAPWSR